MSTARSPGHLHNLAEAQKAAFLAAVQEVATARGLLPMDVARALRLLPYDWVYIYGPPAEEYTDQMRENINMMFELSEWMKCRSGAVSRRIPS